MPCSDLAIINPPVLNGVCGEDLSTFETAYENYRRRVTDMNLSLPDFEQVPVFSYKECISRELLRGLVVLHEFPDCTSPEQVTAHTIKQWIKRRLRCSNEEMPDQVRGAMNKVVFKTDPVDPAGACLQFFVNVTTELRKNRVVHAIDDAPEALINQIVPKLEPQTLRESISSSMKFWPANVRHDFHYFMKKVSETSVGVARYATKRPLDGQSGKTKTEDSNKKNKTEQIIANEDCASMQQVSKGENGTKQAPLIFNGREWKLRCLNSECDGIHPLKLCQNTTAEKKTQLFREYRRRKQAKRRNRSSNQSFSEPDYYECSSSDSDLMDDGYY